LFLIKVLSSYENKLKTTYQDENVPLYLFLIIFNNISKGLTTLLIKYDEKKYPSYSKLKK